VIIVSNRYSNLRFVVEYFICSQHKLSWDTRKKHIYALEDLIAYLCKPLNEATAENFCSWFSILKNEGYECGSLQNYYYIYKNFYKFLKEKRIIKDSPIDYLEKPVAGETGSLPLSVQNSGKYRPRSNLRIIIEYFIDHPDLAANTQKQYIYEFERFIHYCSKPLTKVTYEDIFDWLHFLQEKNHTNRTVLRYYKAIKSLFLYMTENSMIMQNPFDTVKKPRAEEPQVKVLSLNEFNILREQSEVCKRDSAIIETLFFTGVRATEAAKIKISDINFYKREIKILGKDEKTRLVYFTAVCKQKIERYLASRSDGGAYLFRSFSSPPSKSMSKSGIEGVVKKYVLMSGLPKTITPHSFRRGFAVYLWEKGFTPNELAILMGHESVEQTNKYIKLSTSHLKNEYDKYYHI
jgi:site-specific recombinase XerD